MNYLVYILFRIAVFKIRLLPFKCLYIFSDVLAFVLNKVIKYRRNIVYDNIKRCFPDKTEKEIKDISDRFYVNLSDTILEAIKGFSMSEKELLKRYVFLNREILNSYYQKARSVILVGGHFNNWEWGVIIIGKQFENKPFGAYKTISNKYIDNFIARRRTKLNMTMLTMEGTLKGMRTTYDKPAYFVLIADQCPSNHKKAVWVDFFGIKTACLPGVEVASKMFNFPVVYLVPHRIKRGYFEIEARLLFDNPSVTSKGEITQRYMQELEADIRKVPYAWLWSHRRWKHSYEEVKSSE